MPYSIRTIKNFIRKSSIIGITIRSYKQSYLTYDSVQLMGVKPFV
jgi:hypothetical protein